MLNNLKAKAPLGRVADRVRLVAHYSLRWGRPGVILLSKLFVAVCLIGGVVEGLVLGDGGAAVGFLIYGLLGIAVVFGYDDVVLALHPDRSEAEREWPRGVA